MSGSTPESQTGSDNVFRNLGFSEAEAQNLLLRGDLVIHIRKAGNWQVIGVVIGVRF